MDTYLNEVVRYLAAQSWQIALLTATVAAATFALRHRSAHVRYLLWLIVLAKCLVPPLYMVPLRILPPVTPSGVSDSLLQPDWPVGRSTVPSLASPEESAVPVQESTQPAQNRQVDERRLSVSGWLGIIWVSGAGAGVTMNLLRALRGHHWLRHSRKPLPGDMQTDTTDMLRAYGIRRPPRIWIVEGVGQPFVWGLMRGSIYVPPGFLTIESREHRRNILAHELSHIIRFDAAVNFLQTVAQAIFWFHPFVWWANKRIRVEREKCCDETAIARLHTPAKDYCSAVVETLANMKKSTRPVPSLAVAGPIRNIEERIRTMLRPGKEFYKRPSLLAAIVVLLAALLIAPTALVLTAGAEPKAAPEPEKKLATSLHQAAAAGDLERVQALLAQGADVNEKDKSGSMPLYEAVANRRISVVQLLLAKGANVDATNAAGQTPLHRASASGEKYIPELLLAKGANVNARDKGGNTPLHGALGPFAVNRDLVKLLLANGADAKARNEQGETPLHLAPRARRPGEHTKQREEAAAILLAHGAEVDATDNSGRTPLHVAAQSNQAEVVALLLAKGAAVDKKTKDGLLALHSAILAGYKEIVAQLLAKGANVNTAQPSGQTPLHVAAQAGYNEIAELLIAKGAEVNGKNARGETPAQVALAQDPPGTVRLLLARSGEISAIQLAAYAGDLAKVKDYIEKGTSVNAQDGRGLTALHAAAAAQQKEVAEYLMAAGASVNAASAADGLGTPLHYAAHSSATYVADLLVFKGAAVDAENSKGETPLHLAARMGHTEMCRRLITNKANVNAKARNEWTPLHCAAARGQKDAAALLLEKGAAIDASARGRTPLEVAAQERHKEVVKLLVEKGADVSASATDLLYYAAMRGYKELAEACIKKDADVNSKAWGDAVALHVFYDDGPDSWGNVLELLLAHGADPDAKDNTDWSLLHYAVYEDISLVRMLLDKGANPNVIDVRGQSPLHYAAQEGHRPQVELLIAHRADPNIKDYEGRTPLSWAKQKGHNEIVEFLQQHGAKE